MQLASGTAKDLAVVILCGGKGSRIYPFTEYFPKPMMPINGRPILVHLMKIYASQGVRRFVLAAGHRKEMLFDYFEGRFPDWQIDILEEAVAHAVPHMELDLDANFHQLALGVGGRAQLARAGSGQRQCWRKFRAARRAGSG